MSRRNVLGLKYVLVHLREINYPKFGTLENIFVEFTFIFFFRKSSNWFVKIKVVRIYTCMNMVFPSHYFGVALFFFFSDSQSEMCRLNSNFTHRKHLKVRLC